MRERFEEAILLRMTPALRESIDRAAQESHTKPTDWLRRVVVDQLRRDNHLVARKADH